MKYLLFYFFFFSRGVVYKCILNNERVTIFKVSHTTYFAIDIKIILRKQIFRQEKRKHFLLFA